MDIRKGSRAAVGLLLGLCCFPGAAQAADPQLDGLKAEVSAHHSLLNKLLPLPALRSYSAVTRSWRPLPAKPARVRVLSLWSLHCEPCIDELPMLTHMAEKWRGSSGDVQFLFLADPPDQSSQQAVQEFWQRPSVPRLAASCGSEGLGTAFQQDGKPTCLLNLHHTDVVRSASEEGALPISIGARPMTLLLDDAGTVREIFLGSLRGRAEQLQGAIENLLAATRTRAGASARGPGRS
jgi:thiol-disulfide isomerase/thioredoxin